MKKFLVACLLVAGIAGMLQADLYVIKPVDATASGTNGTVYDYMPDRTIDASGLSSGSAVETGDPVPATWTGTSSANQAWMWLYSASAPQWMEFDLGDKYSVSSVHLWNYNYSGVAYDRGIKDVTVQYKNDQGTWVDADTFEFAKATQEIGYTGADYDLSQAVDTQYVRFSIASNWGGTAIGVQEVRFVGTDIPEPATMALLAAGGFAAMIRRRHK